MDIRDNSRLRQRYERALVIAIGMIASIPFYVVIAETIAADSGPFPVIAADLPLQAMRAVAVIGGLLLLFVANLVRRNLLEGDASLATMVTQAMVPQERYASMLKGTLVTLALCDALALLGFVLFLLGGARQDLYAFAAAGLIAAWFHFPRYHQWQRWYAQRSRVR